MNALKASRRYVQTIPAGYPFARTLAANLLDEAQGRPEFLARSTILLPTRRACRVLRECFLDISGGKPILLPRLTPIGDVDEGELSLLFMGQGEIMRDIPPPIAPIRRLLLLSRLLKAGEGYSGNGERAIVLAQALAALVDQTLTEGKDFSELAGLVPDGFAAHWQITLKFLSVIIENWPSILAEDGLVDPSRRRVLLLQSLADYWNAHPDLAGHVVAAGSTGSIPATASLLDVVSKLPHGRVILPGLDRELDEESWAVLDETHPQYQMKKLLMRFELPRADVSELLPPKERPDFKAVHKGRRVLVREIMRPAGTTARWATLKNELAQHNVRCEDLLQDVLIYECDTPQEEAGVVALILREALETHGRTACLVTPDRSLARRVSAQCLRWGIAIDDSAGTALSERGIGRFLLLLLKASALPFDPVALLALLKHPLCRISQPPLTSPGLLQQFELGILRKDMGRPRDLRDALKIAKDKGLTGVAGFLSKLLAILEPLVALQSRDLKPLDDYFSAHIGVAEKLSEGAAGDTLWSGEEGTEAARVLSDLRAHAESAGPISCQDYASILDFVLNNAITRPQYGVHPRLSILGQLEARLSDADLVILSGLNEGTWPTGAAFDPWMSREMRKSFGLPGLERSVGLAAHDFAQAFCAKEIVLTRARKVDGTPTVPARWLQKMDTVLRACGTDPAILTHGPHKEWARLLDHVETFKPCARPVPRPPAQYRPNRVSVTRVESWLCDPYGYYASSVLGLRKLPGLRVKVDPAFRGTIVHKAVESFVKAYPVELPEKAEDVLHAFLEKAVEEALHDPDVIRFWMTRTGHATDWIAGHERRWRERARFLAAEARGEIVFDIDGEPFTLHGRVDRIDRLPDGYAIIDYKSGGDYKASKIESGELPQLPLEALLLKQGGFSQAGIEGGETAYLGYWILRSSQNGEGIQEVEGAGKIDGIARETGDLLITLVRAFRDEKTPYICLPDPSRFPRFNDYEHLGRVREWAVLEQESGEEAA